MPKHILIALFILLLPISSFATTTNRQGAVATTPEKGWFWQYWYKVQQAQKKQAKRLAQQKPKTNKKDPCGKQKSWSSKCGFVDPKGSYDFAMKQYHALYQNAVMHPNNANAVKQFQRYNHWSVKQAFIMMRMWQWNRLQDQRLNPTVTNPTASFALMAMTEWRSNKRLNIMQTIKKMGGFFVFFSRSTCEACKQAAISIKAISRSTGIPVYEASLDGKCHSGFSGNYCRHNKKVNTAASKLKVRFVPDIWLYLPQEDGWFRVSTGMEATSTILNRIEMFFTGIVRATAKGIKKSEGITPNVDFDFNRFQQSGGTIGLGVSDHSTGGKHDAP